MLNKPAKEWIGGRHPVMEALESGIYLDAVWLAKGAKGPAESGIRQICRERRIPLKIVPSEALDRIWRGNHQGVLAWKSVIPFYQLGDIVPSVFESGENPLFVMLDGVTDVRNAGAIARSALGAGAHALVVGTRDVARFNEEAVKASAGALLHLPVCREEPLREAARYLKDSGIRLIGATLEGSVLPMEAPLTDPVCLLLGAEGSGISDRILPLLDVRVRIPQSPRVDSFNVSVAAGILLYEVMRQRGSYR
ncbi:MAG: 23S rRNA (guanosine(2251)-2'-O)-methyltransferase RlmB [Saprospiraceae bacterium]|nr:23S rRNA (guanosine(2251)-2'-O)-methyltransferase RlmB [Saprospiraceae bacterium]